MISIYAFHPNHLNLRVEVDEIIDMADLDQHLESPSFKTYPGMVIQCGPYVGIYGKHHCVDVSANTPVVRQFSIWLMAHTQSIVVMLILSKRGISAPRPVEWVRF